MKKYCLICGREHEEGNMPTYEDAMRGAVAAALYSQQFQATDNKLMETYNLALKAAQKVSA